MLRGDAAMTVRALVIVNALSGRYGEVEASLRRLGECIGRIALDLEERMRSALKDVAEAAIQRDLGKSLEMLEWIEGHYPERLRAILEELLKRLIADLPAAVEALVPVAMKDAMDLADRLTRLLHVLYLHSGDEYFYNVAVIFYAFKLALSQRGSTRSLTLTAALIRLLRLGDVDGSHALAAYAVRETLKRVPPYRLPGRGPSEETRRWALALRVSYDLNVGAKVCGELLAEWGFFEEALSGEG